MGGGSESKRSAHGSKDSENRSRFAASPHTGRDSNDGFTNSRAAPKFAMSRDVRA